MLLFFFGFFISLHSDKVPWPTVSFRSTESSIEKEKKKPENRPAIDDAIEFLPKPSTDSMIFGKNGETKGRDVLLMLLLLLLLLLLFGRVFHFFGRTFVFLFWFVRFPFFRVPFRVSFVAATRAAGYPRR